MASTTLKIKEVCRLPSRLEARRPDANGQFRPRPLRVIFEDADCKVKVLKKASELAKVEHWNNASTHKGVFVQPDRTKAERERDYKLRQEKKTRTEASRRPMQNVRLVTKVATTVPP